MASKRSSYLAVVLLVLSTLVGIVASRSEAASATPTFVHGTAQAIRSGTANNVAFSSSAGNLVVVYAVWNNTAPAAITDTSGNRFAVAAPQLTWGSGWSGEVFYAANTIGGADTITVTFATGITQFGLVYVQEYAGVDRTSPFDTTSAAAGTGSAMSSGVARTTGPDLVIGAGASNKSVTASASGYTRRSNAFDNIVEDKTLARANFPVSTATQSGTAWAMQLVAFHAATVSTTTTVPAPTTTTPAPTTTTPMPTTTTPMPGMGMGADQCLLSQIAFCDTFQTIVGGGREGDLDPAKWSFTRATQDNNPSQGRINNYEPVNAEFCKTQQMRLADNDSFICGAQFGESNHWMEALNDGGAYIINSLRARQPFDFAGRTGNVVFDVDAKTNGPHSFWPEVWLTDEPVQGPHLDWPGTHIYPRNGIQFEFSADWCPNGNALRDIKVFSNYQPVTTYTALGTQCFTAQDDMANHFQLKISSNHIDVWASDAGGVNFRKVAGTDVATLPLTRGYLSFQHAQYNAAKSGSPSNMTYHWHALGFDGPTLPTDRGYEVPDALQKLSDGTINLGYQTPTQTFSLPGVNPTGVAKAYLTYNVSWFGSPTTLTTTINGVDRPATDPNPDWATAGGYQWRYIVQPVALSDLHPGTNTLTIKNTGCRDQCPTVANIDLELVPN